MLLLKCHPISIVASVFCVVASFCSVIAAPPATTAGPSSQPIRGYVTVGQFENAAIFESSGIILSRKYPGVYWTHNDSGNAAEIYAVTGEGKFIAQFPVAAKNRDWEDIAIDDSGQLYIGDVGNNGGRRKMIEVHRLGEPDPTIKYEGGVGPILKFNKSWKLQFPGQPFDCESLFIWNGYGYVVSKLYTATSATIYRFPLDEKKDSLTLERVAQIPVRSPVTAAAISTDGNRLAILTYTGLNLFQIDGDVSKAQKAEPVYTRLIHAGIEGCCFAPGGVLVTAESREIFFFPDKTSSSQKETAK